MCVYIYVCVTQYCKSTIIQYLKKKKSTERTGREYPKMLTYLFIVLWCSLHLPPHNKAILLEQSVENKVKSFREGERFCPPTTDSSFLSLLPPLPWTLSTKPTDCPSDLQVFYIFVYFITCVSRSAALRLLDLSWKHLTQFLSKCVWWK